MAFLAGLRRSGALQYAAFVLLCLLNGSSWVLTDQISSSAATTLAALCAGYVAAGFAVSITDLRPRQAPEKKLVRLVAIVQMVSVTGLPAVLTVVAGRHLSASMVLALWAGLPFCLEFGIRLASPRGEIDTGALLLACLGWAGLLLLLPVHMPGSSMGWIACGVLAGAVVGSGLLAPRVAGGLQTARVVALTAWGDGFLAAIASLLVRGTGPSASSWKDPELLLLLGSGAISAVLVLLLLRWLPPRRWGTQVLIPPVLAIVEAAIVLRAGISARMLAGLGLTAGAAWLLWSRKEDVAPVSLR